LKVLVTGATGFVGGQLIEALVSRGEHAVRAVVRGARGGLPQSVDCMRVSDLAGDESFGELLRDVDVVVHLAARVHVMDDHAEDPVAEYRRINVEATERLAKEAAQAGIRRFIFLSSIKVNGEGGQGSYSETDEPAPTDPYGVSKWEAEQRLAEVAAETGMEVLIIRPPLVYGPGVGANFAALIKVVRKRVPLPFGAVKNRRSFVSVFNLIDLICLCLYHPAAANDTFLVSDGMDLSTADLLRRIGAALGRPARLFNIPPRVLMAGAVLLGRRGQADRLLGSLEIDISKTRKLLGWRPPLTVSEGLAFLGKSEH
jgi:nucleoside-diphosphate-sugar epimerase